jgi:hypothetical protein
MQSRATRQHTPTANAEHLCRPGWRQATYPDGPTKPILIPPNELPARPAPCGSAPATACGLPTYATPNRPNPTGRSGGGENAPGSVGDETGPPAASRRLAKRR